MKVYVLESIEEVDGGYLPDNCRVIGVFSSYELAEVYSKREGYSNTDITEYDLDEEELK